MLDIFSFVGSVESIIGFLISTENNYDWIFFPCALCKRKSRSPFWQQVVYGCRSWGTQQYAMLSDWIGGRRTGELNSAHHCCGRRSEKNSSRKNRRPHRLPHNSAQTLGYRLQHSDRFRLRVDPTRKDHTVQCRSHLRGVQDANRWGHLWLSIWVEPISKLAVHLRGQGKKFKRCSNVRSA